MTQPEFDPYAENPDLADYAKRQAEEWGVYVLAEDYYVGNALAARRGDAIPVDNVKRHQLDEKGIAVKRDSKEGRAVTGEPEPEKPVGDQGAKPAKAAPSGGNG